MQEPQHFNLLQITLNVESSDMALSFLLRIKTVELLFM